MGRKIVWRQECWEKRSFWGRKVEKKDILERNVGKEDSFETGRLKSKIFWRQEG